MTEHAQPVSPEEQAANAARALAEARKFEAEARKAEADARVAELKLFTAEESEEARLNDDEHNRVIRFTGQVSESSVAPTIEGLTRWNRLDPGCPITIVINSPGGEVVPGMALFDTILRLRDQGHEITTVGQGLVASMGGVLLQAGTHRVMTRGSSLLIHEAQFGTMGSFGKVEDMVEWVRQVQERILDIFAERSKMSRATIKKRWSRRDWWVLADEALKNGFVDAIELD